jgi:hypothetical protein
MRVIAAVTAASRPCAFETRELALLIAPLRRYRSHWRRKSVYKIVATATKIDIVKEELHLLEYICARVRAQWMHQASANAIPAVTEIPIHEILS